MAACHHKSYESLSILAKILPLVKDDLMTALIFRHKTSLIIFFSVHSFRDNMMVSLPNRVLKACDI